MEIVVWTIALGVRIAVGLWGHSGLGCPPMFGDFEAQRHWLEVTTSLPIGEWYQHTVRNDLLYWGLDYPPLTAYVSYTFGKLADVLVPELVAFESSRGYEGVSGRVFMRCSVLLCDVILYIPVAILICRLVGNAYKVSGGTSNSAMLFTLSCLTIPGLLLIDHGHFQYNGVCLALALCGAAAAVRDYDILGSVLFSLSLNFKQMSLYYAPVFFCYLLRKCLVQPSIAGKIWGVAKLGITVILTFGILWAPFCVFHHAEETCASSLLQVLHRQFPFSRGIFEDKVANIWYTLSVAVDFRTLLSPSQLLGASLSLTLLLLSPTGYFLLTRPATIVTLLLALINSSLAFFLASFQVHEKSVLLMLAPASFLLLQDARFFAWVQVLGSFTMFPLLVKDKLRVPYLACTVGYLALTSLLPPSVRTIGQKRSLLALLRGVAGMDSKRSWSVYHTACMELVADERLTSVFVFLSYAGMLVLHALELFYPAPARLPDLHAALFSIFGAANLCYIYVVCVAKMYLLGASPAAPSAPGKKVSRRKKD